MATRKWGDEKLVNTSTLNDQETSDVARLTDGSYVVVWADHSGADSVIRGQRFDAIGNKIGAEISISTLAGQTGDQTEPTVTALANGGFFANWNDEDSTTDHDIVGAVFGVNGNYVRTDTSEGSGIDTTTPDVVRLGDGVVSVWVNHAGNGDDINFRIFDGAGVGGSVLVANTATGGQQKEPAVATAPDGNFFVVAWSQDATGGIFDKEIKAQLFSANGNLAGAALAVTPVAAQLLGNPAVAWMTNETFVVAWTTLGEIKARVYAGDGLKVVADLVVSSVTAGATNSLSVTALPNGDFVVAWADNSEVGVDNDSFAIRLRAFDGSGAKLGGEIVVNTTTTSSQSEPSVSALPDGRVVVTWTDSSATGGDTSGKAVRMQIIDPRDGIVTGTPASEALYGHDLVNDEISAGAGNDTLFGLEGNDALYGGQGNDTLVGGLGGDHMFGGIGDDIAIIDSALDRVFENAASGTDQVITPISYQLQAGSHVEVLKTDNVAATTPLNLTGNEFANTLQGNNGVNKLNGGLGNDTMQGMGGNDTYIVANSGDRVVEAAGGGTDTILALLNHTLQASSQVEIIKTINAAATTGINLIGNEFAQRIEGNAGANVLTGGAGNDTLQGLGGNDTLIGGTGNDTLTGGSGNDVFFFNAPLSSISNVERVTDYNVASDTMRLENAIFTGLAAGTLSAAAFRIGAAAADPSDRIIYNNATGAVSFDADGTGATVAIKFAQLAAGLAMTNAEFNVV